MHCALCGYREIQQESVEILSYIAFREDNNNNNKRERHRKTKTHFSEIINKNESKKQRRKKKLRTTKLRQTMRCSCRKMFVQFTYQTVVVTFIEMVKYHWYPEILLKASKNEELNSSVIIKINVC